MTLKLENINMLHSQDADKAQQYDYLTVDYKEKVYSNRKIVLDKLNERVVENLKHLTVSALIIN